MIDDSHEMIGGMGESGIIDEMDDTESLPHFKETCKVSLTIHQNDEEESETTKHESD